MTLVLVSFAFGPSNWHSLVQAERREGSPIARLGVELPVLEWVPDPLMSVSYRHVMNEWELLN